MTMILYNNVFSGTKRLLNGLEKHAAFCIAREDEQRCIASCHRDPNQPLHLCFFLSPHFIDRDYAVSRTPITNNPEMRSGAYTTTPGPTLQFHRCNPNLPHPLCPARTFVRKPAHSIHTYVASGSLITSLFYLARRIPHELLHCSTAQHNTTNAKSAEPHNRRLPCIETYHFTERSVKA